MGTAQQVSRESILPVLNWLGGRVPRAYLRIEKSRENLTRTTQSANRGSESVPAGATTYEKEDRPMSITDDDEHVLSAGDALREAEVAAASAAADTDIFVRGAADTQIESDAPELKPAKEHSMVAGSTDQQFTRDELRHLSIDDLRELACTLQIPDRSKIVDKDELIDEICKRF